MNPPEHYREAERLYAKAEQVEASSPLSAAHLLAKAQFHATMAAAFAGIMTAQAHMPRRLYPS